MREEQNTAYDDMALEEDYYSGCRMVWNQRDIIWDKEFEPFLETDSI
jgi:hypothetical protein